jgi:hypothetical protein
LKIEPSIVGINYNESLDYQLHKIAGSDRCEVRSAVEQQIEKFSVMAKRGTISSLDDFKNVEISNVKYPAIRFNKIFPQFKEYAR